MGRWLTESEWMIFGREIGCRLTFFILLCDCFLFLVCFRFVFCFVGFVVCFFLLLVLLVFSSLCSLVFLSNSFFKSLPFIVLLFFGGERQTFVGVVVLFWLVSRFPTFIFFLISLSFDRWSLLCLPPLIGLLLSFLSTSTTFFSLDRY